MVVVRHLHFQLRYEVACVSTVGVDFAIRSVQTYAHIGGWLVARNDLKADVNARSGLMNIVATPLMKIFFGVRTFRTKKESMCSLLSCWRKRRICLELGLSSAVAEWAVSGRI